MNGMTDSEEIKRMSVDELVAELAEEDEDLDDLIEVELQRRTLAHLQIMSVSLVMLLALTLAGLILTILVLAGVLGARAEEERGGRNWASSLPKRLPLLNR